MPTSEREQLLQAIGPRPSALRIRETWPDLSQALEGLPEVRVAVAATYTADTIVPYLGWELARAGLRLMWTPVPFNQVYPQLLQAASELRTGGSDMAVILPRIEEMLARAWDELPGNARRAREVALEELDNLTSALETFLGGYSGLCLVGNFVRPRVLPLGLLDASSADGGVAFTEWLNQEWRSRLMRLPAVRVLDVAGVLANEGRRHSTDLTRWYLGRIPYREPAMGAIAAVIARSVRAWRQPPKKVLVLDCDGTLWGGIVGEDGPAGVAIGGDAPGNAYAAFQEYLRGLQRRGVLLAVCSKNNEDDAWAVFAGHEGMVLAKDDLSAWRINWLRKSENLQAIARELNVGIDSLVMVDDSPVECEEVRANAPDVAVIQLPEDPAEFIDAIEGSGLFDRLTVTGEDLERHKSYAAERQRDQLRNAAATLDDYLKTLELQVNVFRPGPDDLPRVAQLIARTNQFNLTTRRLTESEVRLMASDQAIRLYGVRVTDRFGDYGLTGVAIVVHDDGPSIDTFLLSCRVLGRGVEHALLRRIIDDARAEGFTGLRARFIPTKKNVPAAAFLDTCGFGTPGDDGWQVLDLAGASLPDLAHIAIV